ncbi:MAG: hypothetical protein ABIH42_09315 [Planctomycetota bacterium]
MTGRLLEIYVFFHGLHRWFINPIDIIVLKDGAVIEGEIIERTDTHIKVKTENEEKIIPLSNIEKIQTTKEAEQEKLDKTRENAFTLLTKKKYKDAIAEFAKILSCYPDDSNSLYNTACAHSLLDNKEKALEFLEKSIKAGFIDFNHIENDSDLNNIRNEEAYKKIIENKEVYIKEAFNAYIERCKQELGEGYNIINDENYKLLIASNAEQEKLDKIINRMHEHADVLWNDFFKNKPNYYIIVILPKDTESYNKLGLDKLNPVGLYDVTNRRLMVDLQSGGIGAITHEFAHALHFADMGALNQRHPLWIVEGFGTFCEECWAKDNHLVGNLKSWRLKKYKETIGTENYISLEFIMKAPKEEFKTRKTPYMCAAARYVFCYLQEKGLLVRFYKEYITDFSKDSTGITTIERLTGKTLNEFEKEWLEFVKALD